MKNEPTAYIVSGAELAPALTAFDAGINFMVNQAGFEADKNYFEAEDPRVISQRNNLAHSLGRFNSSRKVFGLDNTLQTATSVFSKEILEIGVDLVANELAKQCGLKALLRHGPRQLVAARRKLKVNASLQQQIADFKID